MKTILSRLSACATTLICIGLAFSFGKTTAGEPGTSPGRTRTSVERMQPERLEAAHRDVVKHRQLVEEVEPIPGLTDYRASLHVHAEDSDHTGGTLDELFADCKKGNTSIVFLSDHFRPPRDFMAGWRGVRDGVLIIPGSEAKGFLLCPEKSIMDVMDGPSDALIAAAGAGEGMLFLSHVEGRADHPMDGLTGMEIYNRHADAEDDGNVVRALAVMMTDPETAALAEDLLERFHDEFLACQLDYPSLYIGKWDKETQHRKVVGVAAIDCHHNQVFIAKKVDDRTILVGTNVDADEDMSTMSADDFPSITALTAGHAPGDELARLDFDGYYWSFRTVSTHILAEELSEPVIRRALRAGHAYVSHDWMCDPTGYRFLAVEESAGAGSPNPSDILGIMGDEVPLDSGTVLSTEFPIPCDIRLLKNGETVAQTLGRRMDFAPDEPAVYRVEGWLRVDDEDRVWIYSNPIYVR